VELTPLHYVGIGLLGLLFGSFFNVCIHRWPKEDPKEREWVIKPSHCPKCGAPIRWYDNIPLFSWLILLRGKCRDCKAPISWRYPAVEAANSLLWMGTTWLVTHVGFSGVELSEQTGWHIFFGIWFASTYLLTVVIDGETQLLPDEISIMNGVGAVGMLIACHGATISSGWLASLLCGLGLALLFFIFWYFGGMGDGDIWFGIGLGGLFGWPTTLAMLFISFLIGGVIGIFVIAGKVAKKQYKLGKGTEIAYGPFLAIGAYIAMFWGHQLVAWYLNTFWYKTAAGA
jgi:leader peptidase (prepilin peptidase)/N-methyltransferase